jgi:hypothetical protein
MGLQICGTCFSCYYEYFSSFLIISLVFVEVKNRATLLFFFLPRDEFESIDLLTAVRTDRNRSIDLVHPDESQVLVFLVRMHGNRSICYIQGYFSRPVRPNRRGPVPVYRTGSTGNRQNQMNSNFKSKFVVQSVWSSIPTGSSGIPVRFNRFRSFNQKTELVENLTCIQI